MPVAYFIAKSSKTMEIHVFKSDVISDLTENPYKNKYKINDPHHQENVIPTIILKKPL